MTRLKPYEDFAKTLRYLEEKARHAQIISHAMNSHLALLEAAKGALWALNEEGFQGREVSDLEDAIQQAEGK